MPPVLFLELHVRGAVGIGSGRYCEWFGTVETRDRSMPAQFLPGFGEPLPLSTRAHLVNEYGARSLSHTFRTGCRMTSDWYVL